MSLNKSLVSRLMDVRAAAVFGHVNNDDITLLDQVINELRRTEPVRIYDYVWTPGEDDMYAPCWSPQYPVNAGVLFAVVHPSQLLDAYLRRAGDTSSRDCYIESGPLSDATFSRKGWK